MAKQPVIMSDFYSRQQKVSLTAEFAFDDPESEEEKKNVFHDDKIEVGREVKQLEVESSVKIKMSADVCAVLGPEVPECLTTVVEKHGSDGSGCTVLDCLAARDLLTGDRAVCLVCLMHTPVHHRNVLARLGVPKPETHTSLYFFDALSQLGSISGCSPDDLFSQVNKVIASAQDSGISHISLILDDISVLLDIGWDLQQVISFLNRLRSLKLASMAVLTHTAGVDTLTSLLASALIHASDTAVSVLPLSTGLSADVSGTLIVRHLQQPNDMPQSFHFRLMDRQVKVFAPGSIR